MTSPDPTPRFCLWCGAPLVLRTLDGHPRHACSACRFVHYLNPASAAAAVVVRGREILLTRRGIEPYKDCWGFPAGYQEYTEEPQETAVRETAEETGVQIEIVRLLDVLYTRDDPRKRANLHAFLARPVGGELCAGDDAVAVAWFSLDRLPEPIGFHNNRVLLDRLLREYPSGAIL